MFVMMELQWECVRLGMHRATVGGVALAQVAHMIGPRGSDHGWMVWLSGEPDELAERYPTAEAAMRAAEEALELQS